MSLRHRQQGFTIVELLIVIIAVGILTALVTTTFTGIQQRKRDKERRIDVDAIYSQLEIYYGKYVRYPALDQINDTAWRSTNMKTLADDTLKDPHGKTVSLSPTPASSIYSYEPKAADGGSCDNKIIGCTTYTLTATLEAENPYIRVNLPN